MPALHMNQPNPHDETQRIQGIPKLHSRRRRILALLLLALGVALVPGAWRASRGQAFSPAFSPRIVRSWPAPSGIRPHTGVVLRSSVGGNRLVWSDLEGDLHAHSDAGPAFPALLGVRATSAPFLGWDINADGTEDVIFATQDRQLLAIDGLRGTRLAASDWFAEPIYGPPVLCRAQGSAQVVVHSNAGKVARFDLATLRVSGHETYHAGRTRGSASAYDLSSDGAEDVLLGDEQGRLVRLDSRTGLIDVIRPQTVSDPLDTTLASVRSGVCAYDFTGDGEDEWVYITLSGRVGVCDARGDMQATGRVPAVDSSVVSRSPSALLADLTADSEPEIIVAHPDGSIYAFQAPERMPNPLSVLWKAETGEAIHNEVALADFTGDGVCDVAAVTHSGVLFMLNGQNGNEEGRWALDATGSPLIEDLNNDGWLELAVPKDSAWAILETACPASHGNVWPTWRGDAGRRGLRHTPHGWPQEWWWYAVAALTFSALVLWARS